MNITVPSRQRESKGETALISDTLFLAVFGVDVDEAKYKLASGIRALCRALSRAGCLEDAMADAGIQLEHSDNNEIKVKVIVN